MSPLGLIAGGGDLPKAIAQSVREAGREVFVVALLGSAEDWVQDFAHDTASIGEVGKVVKVLKGVGVTDIVLAGQIVRPKFSELKLDMKGAMVAPRIIAAARKGDDALLRAVVEALERDGFKALGAQEAAPGLLAPEGVLGRIKPDAGDQEDIAAAFKIVRCLGELDVSRLPSKK